MEREERHACPSQAHTKTDSQASATSYPGAARAEIEQLCVGARRVARQGRAGKQKPRERRDRGDDVVRSRPGGSATRDDNAGACSWPKP